MTLEKMEITNKNLMNFLQKAKKKTYASKVSIAKKTKDGGKEYIYKKGDCLYKDKYFGFENFRGKETILSDLLPTLKVFC